MTTSIAASKVPQRAYSNDRLIELMHVWRERYGDPVSSTRWIAIADKEFPAPKTYKNRFGSWNEAKRLAGLTVTSSTRRHTRRWSRTDCLVWVVKYELDLKQQGKPVGTATKKGYDAWSRDQSEAPTSDTIMDIYSAVWSRVHQHAMNIINNPKKATLIH